MSVILAPDVIAQMDNYVYRLCDPLTDETLYVGKGSSVRVHAHIGAAEDEGQTRKDIAIRELIAAGRRPIERIVRWGLTKDEAFMLESSLISILKPELNSVKGHDHVDTDVTVTELNARLGAAPYDVRQLPDDVLFVKVRWGRYKPYDDEDLTYDNEPYEALELRGDSAIIDRICGDWRVGIHSARRITRIAAITSGGVVRSVFDAAGLTAVTSPPGSTVRYKTVRYRWSSLSRVDAPYVGCRLVHGDVPDTDPTKCQSPVLYSRALRDKAPKPPQNGRRTRRKKG
jgi:hypothetical protein